MGGRGASAKNNNNQITIAEQVFRSKIELIREEYAFSRKQYFCAESSAACGGGITETSSVPYKKCVCCGEYTIPVFSNYSRCHVCGWIDDPVQNKNPSSTIGRNPLSLKEAKVRWKKSVRQI